VKPINLTVDYMRGGRDKPTRARGLVTRLGTRVANVEAIAWQDEPDRPIAAARMNYLIVR
ncbi:PaaI family thioesterase, partial [Escherichia coli]|nr:PaaI family thioesterase [Escherichia coli]